MLETINIVFAIVGGVVVVLSAGFAVLKLFFYSRSSGEKLESKFLRHEIESKEIKADLATKLDKVKDDVAFIRGRLEQNT